MENNIKVIINSAPRSAHAWLQFLLIHELDDSRQIDIGEGNSDKFIIRSNVPIMTYAKFEDIQQVTILRNPIDLLPSIITKTLGGLGNTVSSGIPMPHEYTDEPDISRLMNDQFNIYNLWLKGIEKNIDNLSVFTFEDVVNDFEFVTKHILKFHNIECLNIKNINKDKLIELAKNRIDVHDKGNYGFNNPIPVEQKPSIYYVVKNIIEESNRIQDALDHYKDVKYLVNKKLGRNNA